ncbi:MAG: Gfo/Idh/MocA family protein [Planctomycetota bacterium]|jgi:predicted dehydrogenase
MIEVGVVGLGFMGRTHLGAYEAARTGGRQVRLAAVSDPSEKRRAGDLGGGGNLATEGAAFDPAEVRAYATASELFADPELHALSLCTPTDTHVDLACEALTAGKHVLVEKPIALTANEVRRLRDVASGVSGLLMPAMCIRFWPGYTFLAQAIADARYGALRGLDLVRLGSRPDWNQGFYADAARSGGALFDLHVHDVDFAVACLGLPEAITSSGDRDHVSSLWHYPRGASGSPPLRVSIEGGWDHDPSFPFRMEFRAVFERATVEFALSDGAALWVCESGRRQAIELESGDGYAGEVNAFLDAIAARDTEPPVTIDDALAATVALEATERALVSGRSETVERS